MLRNTNLIMKSILSGAIALVGASAHASDLDTLLQTGSCYHCVIDGANLSGRNVRFNTIDNSIIKNANLTSAAISIAKISNSQIIDSNFDGSSVQFSSIQSSSLNRISMRNATVSVGSAVKFSILSGNLDGSSVSFQQMYEGLFQDLSLNSSTFSTDYVRNTTINRVGAKRMHLTLNQAYDINLKQSTFDSSAVLLSGNGIVGEFVNLLGSNVTVQGSLDRAVQFRASTLDRSHIQVNRRGVIEVSNSSTVDTTINNATCSSRDADGC